jgi:secernin
MCDTFVVLSEASQNGAVIFGKNSDREPNEAQQVLFVPAQDYPAGDALRCTYRRIPQVAHSHAVLLCKPFWMWGAEMGANQFGVVIGNEAIFARVRPERGLSLTGMDYVRLGLERAASADEALAVITQLLAQYAQGGNCGLSHPFYYQNSFLIADPHGAWVLETVGREWAAERVVGLRSISNAITIGAVWSAASPMLVENALQRGWTRSAAEFSFASDYSDRLYTRLSDARRRQVCTTNLMQAKRGSFGLEDAFATLRAHHLDSRAAYRPEQGIGGAEVCMHAGWGPVRNSQSVGSLVAELTPERQTYWVTGTSAPCTGLFKPLWFEGGLPWQAEPAPGAHFDPACLWWRHEQLHRRLIHDYPRGAATIQPEQQRLEFAALELARQAPVASTASERARISQACFAAAEEAEAAWLEAARAQPLGRSNWLYRSAWSGFDRAARMKLDGMPI